MLSRAVSRSLRTPAVSATPARLRIVSSTIWSRYKGSNNRPPNQYPQKKPTDYNRPQGNSQSQRPTGAGAAFTSSPQGQQGQRSSDNSGKPDYSNRQDEVSRGAAPGRNTVPQSTGGGAGVPNPFARRGEDPEFSGKQEEFNTSALPSTNTAPQSTSHSTIDPAKAHEEDLAEQNQPLPDLTQGIPSTLEYETTGSTKPIFNLTEVAEPSAGGGRTKGELPASAYISSAERKRLRVANYMYLAFAASLVAGTVYLGRDWESEDEAQSHPDAPSGWSVALWWKRARARSGDQLSYYNEPAFRKLLPDPDPIFERPYTLILSLEDLLVHSEWTREHGWRMAKRPGLDYFIRYLSQYYELVIFTSQPWAVAEPIIRKLDPYHIVNWPLFREATLYENGEYVKDLSYLNRDLAKVIMIDTKASHAKKQPENAIVLKPWEGDVHDKELVALIPFLEYIFAMQTPDVRKAITSFEGKHIPTEFAKREAIARQKFQEQIAQEQKKRPKHSGVGFLGSALGIKPGGMVMTDPHEQSTAEAFAQGKMLQDQARERGQRNYEMLEKEIRENGAKWLKEEAAMEEKAKEEATKAMKSGFTGWFGNGKGPEPPKSE